MMNIVIEYYAELICMLLFYLFISFPLSNGNVYSTYWTKIKAYASLVTIINSVFVQYFFIKSF